MSTTDTPTFVLTGGINSAHITARFSDWTDAESWLASQPKALGLKRHGFYIEGKIRFTPNATTGELNETGAKRLARWGRELLIHDPAVDEFRHVAAVSFDTAWASLIEHGAIKAAK